jgi:5'(3')-deoxyribonucleotidase
MNSKKQTIAVDLDDVLSINIPAFVEFSNSRWGMSLTVDSYEENWMRTWNVDSAGLAERTEVIKNEFWHTLAHSGEAVPVLKDLSAAYRLVITTSRRKEVSKVTKDWVNKYFEGIFEEIHHAGIFDNYKGDSDYWSQAAKATKARLCQEIGADYLIDDHIKHCVGADAIGVKAILFGHYPWNRDLNIPGTITRVKNWNEVGKYFAKRGG